MLLQLLLLLLVVARVLEMCSLFPPLSSVSLTLRRAQRMFTQALSSQLSVDCRAFHQSSLKLEAKQLVLNHIGERETERVWV